MPLFPSRDWMDAFCSELQRHPEAGAVAEALHGTYRFVVQPSGPLDQEHSYDVVIQPGDDLQSHDVRLLRQSAADVDLALTADYDRWRQLINGQLDVGLAIMLRRIRVSGDLSRLMGRLTTAQPLVASLRSVDTQWL